MRRHLKTREQRLNEPRNAKDENCNVTGTYWRTDSGFWGWQSLSGKTGLAHTSKQAIKACNDNIIQS
jgi:hypothetical protein